MKSVPLWSANIRKNCPRTIRATVPQLNASHLHIQLTLIISNLMGSYKKFESTVVRLKRSYEITGSVVCLTTKGRQFERNFEELIPALHVTILGTFLNLFDVFAAVFFLSVKFFESWTDNF